MMQHMRDSLQGDMNLAASQMTFHSPFDSLRTNGISRTHQIGKDHAEPFALSQSKSERRFCQPTEDSR